MANESSKLLRLTLTVLSSFPQQGLGQGGATFQDAPEGLDRIVGDRFDGHPILAGQGHQHLGAGFQAYLLPECGGDHHLPLDRG